MRIGRFVILLGSILAVVFFAGCAVFPLPFLGKKPAPENASPSASAGQVAPAPGSPAATDSSLAASEVKPRPRKPPPRTGWKKWLLFWLPQRPLPPPAAQALTPVGRIFLVNARANFVLIETPSARQIPVGEQLHTLRDGRILATVKVSPQRNPPFVVADILEGLPNVGEKVYPVVLGQPQASHSEDEASMNRENPGVSESLGISTGIPPVEAPLPVQSDAEIDRLPPIEEIMR